MRHSLILQYYLGQPCQWNDYSSGDTIIGKLIEVGNNNALIEAAGQEYECAFAECLPILRHIDSVTPQDWNDYYNDAARQRSTLMPLSDPVQKTYLIAKGFDLFHLIEDGLALDRAIFSDDQLGMAYEPVSRATFRLDTQVPDSMGYETHEALRKIEDSVGGDMDNFVRDRLGYKTKAALYKALSAEQIDAVGMAIFNIEGKRQGMIIGDQTGIGKGRIAAAMIRYGVMQGLKPVFLTEMPNLFSDIYRDLIAIGSGHFVPFIVNGRESKTDIKDEHGEVLHHAPAISTQKAVFESRYVPDHYHFVLATYSQFNSAEKKPEKPVFLLAIAKDNLFILDESHNSSGSSNTGDFLQNVIRIAAGAVFLSATFAKRPDNMPIYAMKTAISDCAMSSEELVAAINAGGVALQEILSSQLVAEGQMLRRERTYEGIEVNYLSLDHLAIEHRAIADNITEVLQGIIAFQKTYILPMVRRMDKAVSAEGKETGLRKGTSEAGVDATPYFSKVFNVINQMLFAIKAEAVADRAIMRLKEGKKPVIAFASTMGAFLEDMQNDNGQPVSDGDVIDADFSEVLKRGLDGVMRYTILGPDGQPTYMRFMVSELDPEGQDEYLRLNDHIRQITTGICISPIDIVVKRIKEAGYTVAEVTGRKLELQLNRIVGQGETSFTDYHVDEALAPKDGYPHKVSARDFPPMLNGLGRPSSSSVISFTGMVKNRKRINTNDAFRQFNNNEVDVLLINQSGATGASAHAIATAKVPPAEVRQRVMIVLQAELDINKEVQKRGRIYRTGELLKPIYDYVSSAIPAENRLMMMLQKKLKSLDANTTSNQKNSSAILDVPDFLNKYGDKLVYEYLFENPYVNALLDDPLKIGKEADGEREPLADAAHRVSGRVAVLSTQMQQDFYNEISNRYSDYVGYLKQTGDYDLEVEAMNLEAETISEKIVKMGNGADTAFGKDSMLETIKANVLRKPFNRTELDNMLNSVLMGNDPVKLKEEQLTGYRKWMQEAETKDREAIEARYEILLAAVPNKRAIERIEDPEEKTNAILDAQALIKDARSAALDNSRKQILGKQSYLTKLFEFFHVGKSINYPVRSYAQGTDTVPAVFLGFGIDQKKKNPYAPSSLTLRFAISNGMKYMAIPASYNSELYGMIGASQSAPNFRERQAMLDYWDAAIKTNSTDRRTRYMITGNLLQAFTEYKGKLVSYTTVDGGIKKGILLPDDFEMNAETDKLSVPIIKALPLIKSQTGSEITTDNGVRFIRNNGGYRIIVAGSRQKGGSIYLDTDLLALVRRNVFEKTSDKMVAWVAETDLDEFVQVLQRKHNLTVTVSRHLMSSLSKKSTIRTSYPIKLPAPEPDNTIVDAEEEEMELEALAMMAQLELLQLELTMKR